MAIVSLVNSKSLKSGKAHISKAELDDNKVTLWFKLGNGKIIRENYRLHKEDEVEKLKAAVKAILGDVPDEFDTNSLIGKPCTVRLEERPWTEGKTWTGVAEVLACLEETKPSHRRIVSNLSECDIDKFFAEDDDGGQKDSA